MVVGVESGLENVARPRAFRSALLAHPVAGCRTASVTVAPCTTAVAARRGVRQHARGVTPRRSTRPGAPRARRPGPADRRSESGIRGAVQRVGPDMGESDLHLAVALDGAGWHPAAWREPDARPARAVHRRLLGRPGHRGRTRPARLRDHRGLPRPAVRRTLRARTTAPTRSAAGSTPCCRRPRRPADPAHRARPDRGGHAHRAVPRSPRRSPRWTTSAPAARACGCGSRAGPTRPRTSGGARSATGLLDDTDRRPRWPTCSTRPRTTSRWCGGCGTAGRTTRRSATRPPAASSTATSCTTSTSRARTSPSAAPRSPRGRRRASRSSPRSRTATSPYRLVGRSADLGFVTPRDAADAAGILGEIRAEQDAAGRGGETVHVLGDLVVFLDDDPPPRPRTARSGSTGCSAHEYAATRGSSPARRRSSPTCAQEWRAAGLSGLPAAARHASPVRPGRDHPRPGARAAAARRLPHRRTRPTPCAGCSASPAPPTATPPA